MLYPATPQWRCRFGIRKASCRCRAKVYRTVSRLVELQLAETESALALTLLSRALSIYKPLLIVGESAEISVLLALRGPSSIRRIPAIDEPPTPEKLAVVSAKWRSWAEANWWSARVRVVISIESPLAMAGHGGTRRLGQVRPDDRAGADSTLGPVLPSCFHCVPCRRRLRYGDWTTRG